MPWALMFLLFLPLVLDPLHREALLRRFHLQRKSASGIRFAAPLAAGELTQIAQSTSFRVRWAPAIFSLVRAIAFVGLVIALARPQHGTAFHEVEMSGRDIMLALDISGSMAALDFELNGERADRLTALKVVTTDFVHQRAGDRIGMIVFGSEAFTQCPLTADQNALSEFIRDLEVGMAGQATAIGDGLAIALKRIQSIPENSKVIILVTDGRSNAGALTPNEAAELARKLGVKVYVIGIGGPGRTVVPRKDIFGITRLQPIELEYDERALKDIANITGGKYFNARDTDGLKEIYGEIDKLEERLEQSYEYIDYEEQYLPFAVMALVLFAFAELLSSTWCLRIS